MNKPQFPLPVHIIGFNRPDSLQKLLVSLQAQTCPLDESRVFFWLDGFAGSKDEYLGRPDRTLQSQNLIARFFPRAEVSTSSRNLGIARNFDRAETHMLERGEDAVFFEEDLLLAPDYLTALLNIDSLVRKDTRIGTISAHGIDVVRNTDLQFSAMGELRDPWPLALTHRTWGFLLRHEHARERRPLLDAYFKCLGDGPYWQRDSAAVSRCLGRHGLNVRGGAQDEVKAEIARKLGRMQICGLRRLAATTGEQGEHFISLDRQARPELFDTEMEAWHALGQLNREVVDDMLAVYRRIPPHETLCAPTAPKRGFFMRPTGKSGGLLEVCRAFNTYPAEENGEWGAFTWLKPLQCFYFPDGARELVFQLPQGRPCKDRQGLLFPWKTKGAELNIGRGWLRCGRWSILCLPFFIPRWGKRGPKDARKLSFPVCGFFYR